MSAQLPERPNLEHLRSQAKDLLKAHRAGDDDANSRLSQVADPPFALSHAQLAIAREYGFPSWSKMVSEVEAILSLRGIDDEVAAKYVRACLSHRIDSIKRMLELYPSLPRYNAVTALVSGEFPSGVDPTSPLGPEGWRPLEYVCYSRIHQAIADRYEGQLECARKLLDAGTDPNTFHLFDEAPLPVLFGASSEAAHPGLVKLLLERGANPNDGESVFHAAQHNRRDILAILRDGGADLSSSHLVWGNSPLYFNAGHRPNDADAKTAILGIEWLLENGADPNVRCEANGETPLHALCLRGWGPEALAMFVEHGADTNILRNDGRTAYALAALTASLPAMEYLAAHGADTALSPQEAAIARIAAGQPVDLGQAAENDQIAALFVKLAELGRLDGLRAMLESGVDIASRGEAGATALHFAAFRGWGAIVGMLLEHGAPIDVRDADYSATPLGWGLYGLGENRNQAGDYVEALRSLLAAGADRSEITNWMDEEDSPPELVEVLA